MIRFPSSRALRRRLTSGEPDAWGGFAICVLNESRGSLTRSKFAFCVLNFCVPKNLTPSNDS